MADNPLADPGAIADGGDDLHLGTVLTEGFPANEHDPEDLQRISGNRRENIAKGHYIPVCGRNHRKRQRYRGLQITTGRKCLKSRDGSRRSVRPGPRRRSPHRIPLIHVQLTPCPLSRIGNGTTMTG